MQTYFITAACYLKKYVLQSDRMAALFVDVLQYYRNEKKMLVHEFTVMPNHVHVLVTTAESAEMATKRVKGCFSTRAIKELGYRGKIWQPGYFEKTVHEYEQFWSFVTYIRQNSVKAGLEKHEQDWRFSSASGLFEVDEPPQWLKADRSSVVNCIEG